MQMGSSMKQKFETERIQWKNTEEGKNDTKNMSTSKS